MCHCTWEGELQVQKTEWRLFFLHPRSIQAMLSGDLLPMMESIEVESSRPEKAHQKAAPIWLP